jgi:hypothetical protein
VSDAQREAIARVAAERAEARQKAAEIRWPRLRTHASWSMQGDEGTVRFFDDADGEALEADVAIARSWALRSESWMWGWGNETFSDRERMWTEPVRVFGEVRGIEKLATRSWRGRPSDAWQFTHLAAALLGAEAIHQARFDDLIVFMFLRRFRIVQLS